MSTTGIILFALGFTLGGLILWILSKNKLIKYKEENRHLSLKIKHQDDLRKEREEINMVLEREWLLLMVEKY